MVSIKSLESIATKWSDVTPGRAPFLEEGVRTTTKSWSANSIEGQRAFESAMRDPNVLALRAINIRKAGDEKWKRKTLAVAATRFRDGVPKAKEDFKSGFEPFHGVISAITLPERGARGDPSNYARVQTIGEALHNKRMGAT